MPNPNTHLAFGIDLSRWDFSADGKKLVDFDVIVAHKYPQVDFISMRAGVSWGYQDPWFSYCFDETVRIGRVRMPYHVLFPGEDATRQMDNFFRIIGDADLNTTPLVLDLELDHGHTKSRITATTHVSCKLIQRRTGRQPIIYSRTEWINRFLDLGSLPPAFLWLAQYRWSLPYPLYTPEYPSPPTPLPTGARSWLMHQTTHRGKAIGGTARHFMDHNRFNGSKEDVYAFAGISAPVDPVPLTCPVDSEPCCRILKSPLPPGEGIGVRAAGLRAAGQRQGED